MACGVAFFYLMIYLCCTAVCYSPALYGLCSLGLVPTYVVPLVQDSDVGKFIRPGKFLRESDIIISRVYVYAILYE